jgi:hypothetical protein
LSEADQKL